MTFSVIIATRDRADRLAETLACLEEAARVLDHAVSVLVVDNGRTDSASEVASRLNPGGRLEIGWLRTEPGNKAAALNAGIRAARTEWLAFTDDDARPQGGWLREAGVFAAARGARFFGGRVAVPDATGMNGPRWLAPGRSGRVPKGAARVEYGPLPRSGFLGDGDAVPLGANVFCKREVFAEFGGYDETLWRRIGRAALGVEDAEFGIRLRRGGERIGYCAESVVLHPIYPERATVRHHLRWAYRMGVREMILFPEQRTRGLGRRILARVILSAGEGLARAVRGDSAAAVDAWMECARQAGAFRALVGGRDETKGAR